MNLYAPDSKCFALVALPEIIGIISRYSSLRSRSHLAAREAAFVNGLECFSATYELPENFLDLIISDNAPEHVENPLRELRNLHRALKPGSTACMVVPLDSKSFDYKANNIDYHLFLWSPMNFGSILDCARFSVVSSRPFVHK